MSRVDPSRGPFKVKGLREAAGSIRSDVGWRDFRLVEQADFLAVFNPVFNNRNRISSGVSDEIAFALRRDKPIYVYQNPDHDRAGVCRRELRLDRTSALAGDPNKALIIMKDSLQELFDAIA